MQERRAVILEQILEPAAKDRIQRLGLVKPEKAKRIEDSLISAATSGQLKTKVRRLLLSRTSSSLRCRRSN
jgi:programmed cell death protein 5